MSETVLKSVSSKQGRQSSKSIFSSNDSTPVEKDLAQKAMTDFNKGNYQHTLNTLSKLETSRPMDIKVIIFTSLCCTCGDGRIIFIF